MAGKKRQWQNENMGVTILSNLHTCDNEYTSNSITVTFKS